MEKNISETENYPFLTPFIFVNKKLEIEKGKKIFLNLLKKRCETVKIENGNKQNYINTRTKVFSKLISENYEKKYQKIIEDDLKNKNSFETLAKNTLLLDILIHTAFEYAFQDIQILKEKFSQI